ncbi:hypothetical protein BJX68DRAFT_90486 [Aspergillus pseudodeflectus]|uniref:Uncharacterized protein n=1 Tax=Aspergillus pseudodeflectus TaxID=176178 RepID=A0ABR4L811_9EURO
METTKPSPSPQALPSQSQLVSGLLLPSRNRSSEANCLTSTNKPLPGVTARQRTPESCPSPQRLQWCDDGAVPGPVPLIAPVARRVAKGSDEENGGRRERAASRAGRVNSELWLWLWLWCGVDVFVRGIWARGYGICRRYAGRRPSGPAAQAIHLVLPPYFGVWSL